MAKNILSFFGGLIILGGFSIVALSCIAIYYTKNRLTNDDEFLAIAILSSACLISGTPLLAMARIIGLLEKIEINTRVQKDGFAADDEFKKAFSFK